MRKLLASAKFFVKTAVFFVANFSQHQKFSTLKATFLVKTVTFLVVGLIFIPSLLLAQVTSDFSVSALVGDDITPPTTPTLLSAIPVATSQIDISWSASTDNFILDGYVLLRDGLPIATTTLTTYIDSGLTASTTYSYSVYAFDSFFNLSTTSNSIATTTFAVTVTPPATATSTGPTTSTRVMRLADLNITPSTNSATFLWGTNNPSRFALRWGRNDAYDEGYILNDIYRYEHQTLVSDLEPGTVYLYELIGYGSNNIAITLKRGQFKTTALENLTPANVQNLRAVVGGEDVTLSWTAPASLNNPTIRVVRSYLGYPVDPYDGAIVYEGKEGSFFDQGALSVYQRQYYSVFVIGDDGSVSSGAVVRAQKILPPGVATSSEPLPLEEELVEILDFGFSIENILINQGENHFNFESGSIFISENEAFIISIPINSLPRNLKSIVITLLDPKDHHKTFSFLLRINKDRTAYEATIAPLRAFGVSRLQVEIFDYERKVIGRYRKQIDFVKASLEQSEVIFPDKFVKVFDSMFSTVAFIFLLIFLILFLIYLRSRRTEDNP